MKNVITAVDYEPDDDTVYWVAFDRDGKSYYVQFDIQAEVDHFVDQISDTLLADFEED